MLFLIFGTPSQRFRGYSPTLYNSFWIASSIKIQILDWTSAVLSDLQAWMLQAAGSKAPIKHGHLSKPRMLHLVPIS